MKKAYPILLQQENDSIFVSIPDFNINTQGDDLAHAIEMARDAIGIMGIDIEDEKEALPQPTKINTISKENANDIVTLVDVDFTEYRRKLDRRTVKKNCTLPSSLCFEAEKAGLNFSALLQQAIKTELHIQ